VKDLTSYKFDKMLSSIIRPSFSVNLNSLLGLYVTFDFIWLKMESGRPRKTVLENV